MLELLSQFQISIPELGTIKAKYTPIVILTSNRTRDLSDALKRRCLYHWVDYPSIEKEIKILRKHQPDLEMQLADTIARYVNTIRKLKLEKTPGVAETLDWARGIAALGSDQDSIYNSLSCLIKSKSDMTLVKEEIFN